MGVFGRGGVIIGVKLAMAVLAHRLRQIFWALGKQLQLVDFSPSRCVSDARNELLFTMVTSLLELCVRYKKLKLK